MSGSSYERRVMLAVPSRVTACLFDLDGVLTQTARVHAAAGKEMFTGSVRYVQAARDASSRRAMVSSSTNCGDVRRDRRLNYAEPKMSSALHSSIPAVDRDYETGGSHRANRADRHESRHQPIVNDRYCVRGAVHVTNTKLSPEGCLQARAGARASPGARRSRARLSALKEEANEQSDRAHRQTQDSPGHF